MSRDAINAALRMARKFGGRAGYAEGGVPEGDIPMPDARTARQIQNRAMRGYEPTSEQASFLESVAPGKEARGESLSGLAPDAASMLVPGGVYLKALKYAGVPAGLVAGGALLDGAKAQTAASDKPVRYDGAPRPRQQVQQLQKQLLDAGFNVKVDGNDGDATRDAELLWKEKRAAEDRRLRADEQAAQARATEATTAATKATTDAAERAEGLKKFETAQNDPANKPSVTPNMGYGIGAGIGALLGLGTSAAFDWKARSGMKTANALLANVGAKGKEAAGTISERVGKVNEFAKLGGAEKVPFTRAPTKDPPWRATPGATPASDLFPARSMKPEYMTQGAGVVGGLTEMGVAMWMGSAAHQRLKEAEEAVKATPNPATIAAYLDARSSANMWDVLDNAGRGSAGAQAAVAKVGPLVFGGNRRPNVPKHEGEVGEVSSELSKATNKAKAYDEKIAAEKAATEQQKAARAAARAAKKPPNSKLHGATGLVGGSQLVADPLGQEESSLPISQAPASPAPDDEGFNRGGIVGRALGVAKKFSTGGAVHAGPIQQAADGGRTDTVRLDVAAGCYVIPADIVSGLGQGDTSAGYRALEGMFGAHAPQPADASGNPVPILAAGGEFVISPEVVAKIGKGDLKVGHEALDHWVRMQRRKTIQELKKLPGPARD